MNLDSSADTAADQRLWRPLTREQRRVIGVLVEKAKTTPDAYPMTVNAITTGSNQKSNRSPQMSLDAEDVQVLLDELREMGAVIEVQTGGRVAKYKHRMYEWLGVDKFEIAVMTELLLRGEQTLGDLRGRASRMEKIADVAALKPIVRGLIDKQLMVELTPEGRGQLVTHTLYLPEELERVKARAAAAPPPPAASPSPSSRSTSAAAPSSSALEELKEELADLRKTVEDLRDRIGRLENL